MKNFDVCTLHSSSESLLRVTVSLQFLGTYVGDEYPNFRIGSCVAPEYNG